MNGNNNGVSCHRARNKGTVAECHFGYNFHISVKIVSKFFGLPKGKQKNLFTNFVSKFRKFRSKSTFGNSPIKIKTTVKAVAFSVGFVFGDEVIHHLLP